MIAAFVFSMGILTVVALQLKGINKLSNSSSISAAMISASDMADRMRANHTGVENGSYDSLWGQYASDPACGSTCNSAQQATLDVYSVYQEMKHELPESSLQVINAGDGLFTIDVLWLERNGAIKEILRHRFSFRPYNP